MFNNSGTLRSSRSKYRDKNNSSKCTKKCISCAPKISCQSTKTCNKKQKQTPENNDDSSIVPVSHMNQNIVQSNFCRHSDLLLPNPNICNESEDGDRGMRELIKRADVYLERDPDGSLGITLQGGLSPNGQYNRPLVITHLKPDGPAYREGTVQIGDRLLFVDGLCLDGVTLNHAYSILTKCDGATSVKLTIEYDVVQVERYGNPLLVELETTDAHHLGITLTNIPHNAAVLIDEVRIASIAERCGALHAGDQILAVNDTRIQGSRIAATEVYKLFRTRSNKPAILLLEILPAAPFTNNQIEYDTGRWFADSVAAEQSYFVESPIMDTTTEIYPFPPLPSNETNGHIFTSEEKCKKEMTITLKSDDAVGYGIHVKKNLSNLGCVICSITPFGPAYMCEQIQINDTILLVNGNEIQGITNDPQPLHKVPGIPLGCVALRIEYYVNNSSLPPGTVFTVLLNKLNNRSLGITMTGSSEFMVISEIKAGSIADRCGSLCAGDRILCINNYTLANYTVEQAVNILHSQSDSVSLQVQKRVDDDTKLNVVEYTVELNKSGGPIGIKITGSETTPREITISSLTPGGLAEKTGALHIGDRVIAINHIDVTKALLSDAISFLHNYSKDKVLIKVSRPVGDETGGRVYGSPGLHSVDSAVESCGSSFREQSPQRMEHNFSAITNSIPDDSNERVSHKNLHLKRSSPEYEIYKSDDYLSLMQPTNSNNYAMLINNSNEESIVDSTENDCTMSDIDRIFSLIDIQDKPDESYEIYQVTLYKDPLYEDFGFSVSDGLYERGVFINRIRQGGPADIARILKPYDRIIQVNNTRTDDFDCCLTVPLVASAGNRITLTLARRKYQPQLENYKLTWAEDTQEHDRLNSTMKRKSIAGVRNV